MYLARLLFSILFSLLVDIYTYGLFVMLYYINTILITVWSVTKLWILFWDGQEFTKSSTDTSRPVFEQIDPTMNSILVDRPL